MNDLISRQWLMECVNEGWIKFDTEKDENRFIHLVRDIAPSAQAEQHWIPCSESLPDAYIHIVYDDSDWFESDCVVIQDKEGHFEVCRMCVDRNSRISFCGEGSVATEHELSDVIVWMPLPEPYREDKPWSAC